jgi:hypothetical protein
LDNNVLVDFNIDQILSLDSYKLNVLADNKANSRLGVTNSSIL